MHGADGEAWLRRRPAIIAACAEHWNISLARPFPHLSHNDVVPAQRRNGTPVVLKIGYAGSPEFVTRPAGPKTCR
jgi:hypothetical protein